MTRHHATIYLLHTSGEKGTWEVAERLERRLNKDMPQCCVIRREIDDIDGKKIEAKLSDIIAGPPPIAGAVGLNYSGGTKPMAVHVHHALRKAFPDGCFSYLDARSLKMVVRSIELGMDDVVDLHGYKITNSTIRRQPQYADLFRPLAKVAATKQGFHEWTGRWNKQKRSKGWLQQSPLKTLPTVGPYPRLGPLIKAFEQLGGTPEAVAAYLRPEDDEPKLESCRNWFKGTWLEEYCLDVLADVARHLNLTSYMFSVRGVVT